MLSCYLHTDSFHSMHSSHNLEKWNCTSITPASLVVQDNNKKIKIATVKLPMLCYFSSSSYIFYAEFAVALISYSTMHKCHLPPCPISGHASYPRTPPCTCWWVLFFFRRCAGHGFHHHRWKRWLSSHHHNNNNQ